MTKLRDILENICYQGDQLMEAANLLYLTGGIDGNIKKEISDNLVLAMLDMEISIEEFNNSLQENYFKKFRGNGERQQIEPNLQIKEIRNDVIAIFEKLGFVSAVNPNSNYYDLALVFGATENTMKSRFSEMLKNTAKEIYMLAGARDLWLDAYNSDPCCAELVAKKITEKGIEIDIESVKNTGAGIFNDNSDKTLAQKRNLVVEHFENQFGIQWPTEADAAHYIISQQDELIKSKAKVVDAPKQPNGSRPDTFDTVVALQNKYPEVLVGNKTAIAISDQPNIPAQALTLKLLPPNINTTTIGKAAHLEKETIVEEMLSSFAGMIFKEMQLEKFLQN